MKIHLIHGINTPDPYANIGKLEPALQEAGYSTLVHSYGNLRFWQARFKNDDISKDIAKLIRPDDILIGHSNGCELIRRILDSGVVCRGVVLINPALDRDTKFAKGCEFIHVYHNDGDWVVQLARYLPFNYWGDMGKVGYVGKDLRVTNYNNSPLVDGHSEPFDTVGWDIKLIKNIEDSLNVSDPNR